MSYDIYNTLYLNNSTTCKKEEAISNLLLKLDKSAKENEHLREEIEYLKFCICDLTNSLGQEETRREDSKPSES